VWSDWTKALYIPDIVMEVCEGADDLHSPTHHVDVTKDKGRQGFGIHGVKKGTTGISKTGLHPFALPRRWAFVRLVAALPRDGEQAAAHRVS
jgi:hypothetical protein